MSAIAVSADNHLQVTCHWLFVQSFRVGTTTASTRVHVRWTEVEWSSVSVLKGSAESTALIPVTVRALHALYLSSCTAEQDGVSLHRIPPHPCSLQLPEWRRVCHFRRLHYLQLL